MCWVLWFLPFQSHCSKGVPVLAVVRMLCLLWLKDGDGNQVLKLKELRHHFGMATGDVASSLITRTLQLSQPCYWEVSCS